jgi:hypothetical protein
MRKNKRLIIIITVLTMMFFSIIVNTNANNTIKFYSMITKKAANNYIRILQTDEVTNKVLTNRKDRYIVIEITIGKVLNNNKDGKVLNTKDRYYNYISYKGIKGIKKNDKIITITVYANNNEEDNIAIRFDKKIRK